MTTDNNVLYTDNKTWCKIVFYAIFLVVFVFNSSNKHRSVFFRLLLWEQWMLASHFKLAIYLPVELATCQDSRPNQAFVQHLIIKTKWRPTARGACVPREATRWSVLQESLKLTTHSTSTCPRMSTKLRFKICDTRKVQWTDEGLTMPLVGDVRSAHVLKSKYIMSCFRTCLSKYILSLFHVKATISIHPSVRSSMQWFREKFNEVSL